MHSRLLPLLTLLLLLSALPLTAQETLVVTGEGSAPAFACVEADCERLAWLPGGAGVSVIGELVGRELEGSALWYEVQLDCPCFDFERNSLHDMPDTKDPERTVWYDLHLYWAPDSRRIATVARDGFHVWDADSGERLLHETLNLFHPSSMAWSPDGSRIAAGGGYHFAHKGDEGVTQVEPERSLLLIDADGRSPQPLSGQAGGVRGLAWSHDGTRIATVGETLRILDAQQGNVLLNVEARGMHLAWSSDDRFVALIEHDQDLETSVLRLRDALNGKVLMSIEEDASTHFGGPVWAPESERFAYTTYKVVEREGDSGLVTGSELHVRDAFGENPPRTLLTTDNWILHFDWSPDGRFIVLPLQGGIHVLDSRDGRRVASLAPESISNNRLWQENNLILDSADWSPDGERIVASGMETGSGLGTFHSAGLVWDLTLIPEGPTRAFIHSSQLGGA
ncbi:MAG: hypothetical protein OXF32_09820 [Anaerolineaceae bacterium]|nr:hypothetical protein [Anaerolineaceae bacterium]